MSMINIPSLAEIEALHAKYAPSKAIFEHVFVHCQIVSEIAMQIAGKIDSVNKELVRAGALLHDIGVYRLYQDGKLDKENYITHGLLGYELLKSEGVDEEVARFPLLHTGVGITRQDIKAEKLPLPLADYVAETEEEQIVMFADKFHSKSEPPAFNSVGWYTNFIQQKFGSQKAERFAELIRKYGTPDLEPLMQKYRQSIR